MGVIAHRFKKFSLGVILHQPIPRYTETVEAGTEPGLGMGSGGLSEDQLFTATLAPEANTKSGERVLAQGESAPPLRLRQV
jgi:hypothetical protein